MWAGRCFVMSMCRGLEIPVLRYCAKRKMLWLIVAKITLTRAADYLWVSSE